MSELDVGAARWPAMARRILDQNELELGADPVLCAEVQMECRLVGYWPGDLFVQVLEIERRFPSGSVQRQKLSRVYTALRDILVADQFRAAESQGMI